MKIIDLLNMISKGEEVPKKIKYVNAIYVYDEDLRDYVQPDYLRFSLFTHDKEYSITDTLNNEVEIIEDIPKNIEKIQQLEAISDCDNFTTKNGLEINPYLISATNRNIDKIFNKVNEIIDYINKESK